MPYIDTIPEDEATGTLARQYAASRKRDRRVSGVVRLMSHEPEQGEVRSREIIVAPHVEEGQSHPNGAARARSGWSEGPRRNLASHG